MAKILVTDGMDKKGVEELKAMGHEVIEQFYELEDLNQAVKEADAIIIRSATKIRKPTIEAAKETGRLKLIVRAGVGVDNIDVKVAEESGISVKNTPNASSAAVAELAIGQMFALARHIYASNVTMREGKWLKNEYKGIELAGKTLGLIGFGRIAQETAKRADALGMKVIYNTRSGKKDGFDQFDYQSFETVIKESDFISLHVPYDKEKGTMVGKSEFEMMKKGVYIVNCARGGVVDESALLEALDNGIVSAAALDVFSEEPTKNDKLVCHEKVSVTPHVGASTKEAQARIGQELVKIVKEFF